MTDQAHSSVATTNHDYAVGLGRAVAGATIFGLPLLMTMEMWWLGHTLDPWKLFQFTLANLAMLYGLSRVSGFEQSNDTLDDLLDSFAAYAVAAVVSLAVLVLIGVIDAGTAPGEAAGKVAIQAIPASFGAMIGGRLLGEGDEIEANERWRNTYQGQLFLFAAGALFLSFTIAPTEEIVLISFAVTPWHGLALGLTSIVVLHIILHFEQSRNGGGSGGKADGGVAADPLPGWALFFRHTLPGYAIAILVACYILWTFGRTDGLDLPHIAMVVAVLGFPAALGAGVARIVI